MAEILEQIILLLKTSAVISPQADVFVLGSERELEVELYGDNFPVLPNKRIGF